VYETVLLDQADGVATVTLNRPDVLNSFNATLHRELEDALKRAERDAAVRAVVVTGAGRAFCAGQDLKAHLDETEGRSRTIAHVLREQYNPLILRLRNLEKPVLAAVNGVAAGAGVSLAMACDLRLASDKASFIQAFVGVGLIPDAGATWFLPRHVGLGKAFELAFLGDRISAGEALALGLVNRVVPADEFEAATRELAGRLARQPTRALGLMKRAFNRALRTDLAAALDYEAFLQGVAGATEDHAEGVAAFLQKRPPQFKGR